MANASLGNSVILDQSEEKIFSLTFTQSQWHCFWRMMIVGCILSDDIIMLAKGQIKKVTPEAALLWNRLADEFALLINSKVTMH